MQRDDDAWIRDLGKVYEKLLPLVGLAQYRKKLLEGVTTGLGTKLENAVRLLRLTRKVLLKCISVYQVGPAAASFSDYASSLDVFDSGKSEYSLLGLCNDLVKQAKASASDNRVFIPTAQTLGVLIESELVENLSDTEEGSKW
jgi:hypothetical protein